MSRHCPSPRQQRLVLEVDALGIEHVLDEVQEAVARRFRARQRAPVIDALSRQHAGIVAVTDALVLTEEIANLAAADADIAGRSVDIRTDMAIEFRHEALAEVHGLIVAAAVRVEIRAALGAANRQSRQGILVDLFESQKLQDIECDARMEAQAALVRPIALDIWTR